MAFRTADENESTIILANDPDADRLAIAEKQSASGEWKVFTGNETGALFGWWMWHNFKENFAAELKSDAMFAKSAVMLYSTVSSQILRSMAEVEGFHCEDTLTGFKWMGNRAHELMSSDSSKRLLFCFEEAIGFLCGDKVLDKDGVSAEVRILAQALTLSYFCWRK